MFNVTSGRGWFLEFRYAWFPKISFNWKRRMELHQTNFGSTFKKRCWDEDCGKSDILSQQDEKADDSLVQKGSTEGNMDDKITYDAFAPYYDHYMQHVDYDKWVKQILAIYDKHTNLELNDILELACGTGNAAYRFVEMGYKVRACDRSMEMLKMAENKLNPSCLYIGEMTDPIAEDAYDMIACIFDSINYLIRPAEISSMLENVYKGLHRGGMFIFDISTHKNSVENFDGYVNVDDTKDYYLVHQADYDEDNRFQKTKITVFQRYDNHYVRMDEQHIQRVYKVAELVNLADKSPLECVGIYSVNQDRNLYKVNFNKLDHLYSRLFFALKKHDNES